ncbi:MAG: radical SAM protein [Desulfovibrio sp.]|nr:radical SAM protein [Desulfovibrio sp.]
MHKILHLDSFPAPTPPAGFARRILPVFLPFAGCATRCIFCAQHIQTGLGPRTVTEALDETARQLDQAQDRGAPDLAFYGGTFTALAPRDFSLCLDFTRARLADGKICGARCSTRPDQLDAQKARALKEAGFSLLELGVQSFQDTALSLSRRGYDARVAKKACALAKANGLELGIQLMPGMPGLDTAGARGDVRAAIALAPACVRLYPCLVLAGTELEDLWRSGSYQPWELARTVDFLADALLRFQAAGIPVIRAGLADTPETVAGTLAGPRHPALGNMVRALALYKYIRNHLRGLVPKKTDAACLLTVPRRLQGDFWGHRGELAVKYAKLGLGRASVRWGDREDFVLCRYLGETPP